MIRIGISGAGLAGKRHVEAVTRSKRTVVAGIADPCPAAREFADGLGLPWFPDLSELLATGRPDGVVVATPNHLHLPQGLECIRAGVPILVEKPIADSVRSAERLVDRAERSGTPVLVGHHRRHNPLIRAARAEIANGAIGRIVAVHGMCWLYKPDSYFETRWRTRKGAGPVFINLIHDVDLLRYLVGEVASVEAFESRKTRNHHVEDTAAIVLRFACGALGTLGVSDTIVSPWSWELTAAENPAYPATGQNCYFLGGTHGALEIPRVRLWTQDGTRGWWEPIGHDGIPVVARDPLDLQIGHFCDVIESGEKPLVSGLDGLRSLRVIERIKQAAGEHAG